jgi:hypothetical protein
VGSRKWGWEVHFRHRGSGLGSGIEDREWETRVFFRQRGRGLGSGIEDKESGSENPC